MIAWHSSNPLMFTMLLKSTQPHIQYRLYVSLVTLWSTLYVFSAVTYRDQFSLIYVAF